VLPHGVAPAAAAGELAAAVSAFTSDVLG
jgi:hypothetical protein